MAKGGSFERYISKFLTKWLTGKEKPYAFWRMPASGGLATISEENKDLSGDIIGITIEAKEICSVINIECKTGYPQTSFWQHFRETNFKTEEFWKQSVHDASKANKHPVLIYRKKNKRPAVGITSDMYDELYAIKYSLFDIPSISIRFPVKSGIPELVLLDFEKFFDCIRPEELKQLPNYVVKYNIGETR